GCRISKFYRFAIAGTTDQLLREGYGLCKFFWITDIRKKKRIKSSDQISFFGFGEEEEGAFSQSGWKIGANMRNIVYHDEPEAACVGLFALPGMHTNEILAGKAKLRHFMPNRSITLNN